VALSWRIFQRNHGIKALLFPDHTRNMTLARQVFSQQHITRSDALNRPIPHLDFCFPG
jgi:hypothetical protein